jgi:hypothetical protein
VASNVGGSSTLRLLPDPRRRSRGRRNCTRAESCGFLRLSESLRAQQVSSKLDPLCKIFFFYISLLHSLIPNRIYLLYLQRVIPVMKSMPWVCGYSLNMYRNVPEYAGFHLAFPIAPHRPRPILQHGRRCGSTAQRGRGRATKGRKELGKNEKN